MRGIALALSVMVASATSAAAQARDENLALGAAGAQACAAHLPDARAMSKAMAAVGFQLKESNGQLKLYTDPGMRVGVAFTTLRSSNGTSAETACFVAVDRMTPAQGRALIQPWVQAANARPVAPTRNMPDRWQGTFKGSTVLMGVLPTPHIPIIRGAAIVAAVPN